MLKVKLFKYDSSQEANGYRGTDYSDLVLQGFQDTEDITQEMDTSEITICGLDRQQEFDPETKFIIDIVDDTELGEETKTTLHRVVARDTVEQPILSDDHYFNHHISLIEPSVIAQKRLVDNISATYKLKDVSLETKTAFPQQNISSYIENSSFTPARSFGLVTNSIFGGTQYIYYNGKYFEKDGEFKVITPDNVEKDKRYLEIDDFDDNGTKLASFKVPKLKIMCGVDGQSTFDYIGDASIDYIIEEYSLTDEYSVLQSWSGSFISNDRLGYSTHTTKWDYDYIYDNSWILEETKLSKFSVLPNIDRPDYYYRKYTDPSQQTAPTYITQQIPIQKDRRYKITISLHQFDDPLSEDNEYSRRFKFTGENISTRTQLELNEIVSTLRTVYGYVNRWIITNSATSTWTDVTFYHESILNVLYSSSIPYSALALLQKAIINSSIYKKKGNVYIADVNNSDLPFIIDPEYIDRLKATKVIENFYNQKNLWELMIDVGHYIHAIPELRFGADDKFVITFNELGRTDQHEDGGTKINIYNSRNVEDYISATSSYVTNMVQLGGYIEEWVAPKTSDETLLISNDTANITTTKPIIELLQILVKANTDISIAGNTIHAGDVKDMTQFVFEENIYKTLTLDHTLFPNRGVSIYYKLGTNEITGCNYQLPQSEINVQTDYALKKVIYSAYFGYTASTQQSGLWGTLKVTDFDFFVKYRTKDTVRQNHVRPDLRKYLLNSKYDKYPEHNQFNNQQDILVDSIKFGNNVYGKLIKTGNSEYTKQEWVDNYDNVKHKGELYNINGQLYYVANVTNYYYSSHIISEVKFSKDYNELSAVIGIPSEPRFYEISEQSAIQREFAINDIAILTDDANMVDGGLYVGSVDKGFVYDFSNLKTLLFSEGTSFAKYALTAFKGDKDSINYDQTTGQPDFYKEILSPINAYSSENTLTYEWDMVDNYSAGDKVIDTQHSQSGDINTIYYKSLRAVPYTDKYGKAPLLDFFIIKDIDNLTSTQIRNLPESPVSAEGRYIGTYNTTTVPTSSEINNYVMIDLQHTPQEFDMVKVVVTQTINNEQVLTYYKSVAILTETHPNMWTLVWNIRQVNSDWKPENTTYVGDTDIFATNEKSYSFQLNNRGLGLLKDNRETISCNYNLQMITNSDTFVLSPFLFLPNKQNIKVVLLSKEVNKLTDGYINNDCIIAPLNSSDVEQNPLFNLSITDRNGFPDYWTNTRYPSVYVWNSMKLNLSTIFNDINNKHFVDQDDGDYERVKAIAIICDVSQNPDKDTDEPTFIDGKTQFIMAKNIPEHYTKAQAIQDWYIGPHNKTNLFVNKQ